VGWLGVCAWRPKQNEAPQQQSNARYSPWHRNNGGSIMRCISQISNQNVVLPAYSSIVDGDTKVKEYIANEVFYWKNLAVMNEFEQHREASFGEMTMREAFEQWHSKDTHEKIKIAFLSAGARIDVLERFMNADRTIEKVLHQQIIALNAFDEIELIEDRFVHVGAANIAELSSLSSRRRVEQIVYLLGPSGSGKTFFAVKEAATYGWDSRSTEKVVPYTTVYLRNTNFDRPWEWKSGAEVNLVEWIKETLHTRYPTLYDKVTPLDLNLAVVLDEAGANILYEFYEKKKNVFNLHCLVRELVGPKNECRIIVCGTGLTARELDSTEDVIKVRLKPWTADDMKKIVVARSEDHFYPLSADTVDAIFEFPVLEGLTSISRTAWLLLQAIKDICVPRGTEKQDNLVQEDWQTRLYASLNAIVQSVVRLYSDHNGLRRLSAGQRRRVAASVFYYVEMSRREFISLPSGDRYVPTFLDLPDDLRHIAAALITVNVDYKDDVIKLADPKRPSIQLSPAITLVVFSMLGATTTVVAKWISQETISAWCVFRRQVIEIMEAFVRSSAELGSKNIAPFQDADSLKTALALERNLDEALSILRLVQVLKRVPESRATTTFKIPIFDSNVTWINFDMAPFADVVRLYTLVQAKFSEDTLSLDIAYMDELLKCGLLEPSFVEKHPGSRKDKEDRAKRAKRGWHTLSILCLFWNRILHVDMVPLALKDTRRRTIARMSSVAYPENCLQVATPKSEGCYVEVEVVGSNFVLPKKKAYKILDDQKRVVKKCPIPVSLQSEITYITTFNTDSIVLDTTLETSSKEIRASFGLTRQLVLSSKNLDRMGNIIEYTLTPEQQDQWDIIKSALRPNLALQFWQT
jgi:hypothetical protein